MRWRVNLLRVVTALPLFLLPALWYMPYRFPMLFSTNGAPRWGNKLEVMAHILIPVAVGLGLLASEKNFEPENRGFLLVACSIGLFIYTGLPLWVLFYGFRMLQGGYPVNPTELHIKLAFLAVGIALTAHGYRMPRLPYKSPQGVNLSFAIRSEAAWRQFHRRCGIAFLAAGLSLTVFVLFLHSFRFALTVMVTALAELIIAVALIAWRATKVE